MFASLEAQLRIIVAGARAAVPGKASCLAGMALLLWVCCCQAGEPLHLTYSSGAPPLAWFDGRAPDDLPPPFRNHCGFLNGRWYCAERCGTDYQFYYCSRASYGCCHIADGYCDYRGFLRCRP